MPPSQPVSDLADSAAVASQLATGLGGAIGCDFRASRNQLVFVEFAGKLSRVDLFRPASIVSQGTTILKATFTFDLDNGIQGGAGSGFDIWWEHMTAVARQMVPRNNARIVNLGKVDFNTVTPDSLQTLTYGPTAIPGSNDASNKLVTGDVFAVLTNQGNYAKVKVVTYGTDLKIQWATYHLNSAYAVLGSGYQQPEDVKVSADDVHAYVTERTGALLRVALNNANRAAATVVASGMTAPHQIFLDEVHNTAYVVEFAAAGHLWSINLTTGNKTAVVSNLNNAVGLVLSADLQYAYVSEQTAGPDQGRVSRIQMSNGSRATIASGLTNPFFLEWTDGTQTALLVPERDPANRISSVSVNGGGTQVVAVGVPMRPSSTAVPVPGKMLICSDQIIEALDFAAGLFQAAGPLIMGIGFIPFDKVQPSGLATTDPGYFYAVTNVPFGGTLPLMVNHLRAFNDGAAYYRVKVGGVIRSDSWTDYKWNGTQYVLQTIGAVNVGGQPGYFPVHALSDLFLWMNPSLGMLMDSTNLSNALHEIKIEFVNGAGVLVESSTPLTIMVNNQSCTATIAAPVLNGATADATCGLLHYVTKNNALVTMAFTASHPSNYATWSFSLIKGINGVPLPGVTSGPVPAAGSVAESVNTLMGNCNVAGFAESVYAAATINNGWGRQSQYDASAAIAFVLAP